MITNLLEDITKLTDVSDTTLKKLLNISNYVFGHAIHESMCQQEFVTSVDIGIGQLDIKLDPDGVRYKFYPSKELEKVIVQTIQTKTSPIIAKLDTKLQERIDRAYKELL